MITRERLKRLGLFGSEKGCSRRDPIRVYKTPNGEEKVGRDVLLTRQELGVTEGNW